MTINNPAHWHTSMPLRVGDTFTIAGLYKRRTFWQWIKKEPRQLKQFMAVSTSDSLTEYKVANG